MQPFDCAGIRTSMLECNRFQPDAGPQGKNGYSYRQESRSRDAENLHWPSGSTPRSIPISLKGRSLPAMHCAGCDTGWGIAHHTTSMRRLQFLVAFLAGVGVATASPFPWWFHTRPKPVYFTTSQPKDRRTPPVPKRPPPHAAMVASPAAPSATQTGSSEQSPVPRRPNRTPGRH
jgi:hypothetical protein